MADILKYSAGGLGGEREELGPKSLKLVFAEKGVGILIMCM